VAVRPVSYSQTDPVFRGAAPEAIGHKPMPAGDPTTGLYGWRRGDDVVASTGRPTAPAVTTSNAGPVLPPGAVPGGVPIGVPVGVPAPGLAPDACAGGNCAPPCPCPPCPGGPCVGGNCGGGGCPGCCDFGNRWYVTAEYLLWGIRPDRSPPLVSSPPVGAVSTFQNPLVDGRFDGGPTSGARLLAGYWFTDDHALGLEFGGFVLGDLRDRHSFSGTGTPTIIRPFINLNPTGTTLANGVVVPAGTSFPDAEVVSGINPATGGVLGGTVRVDHRTSLWGYEANLKSCLLCGCDWYLNGLVGFRGLALDDTLNITENLMVLAPPPAVGTTFQIRDGFNTTNRFYGAQVGLEYEHRWGNWSLGLKGKVAMGPTHQSVEINGTTITTVPGQAPAAALGGLLAQRTNIGRYDRDSFTVVPEGSVTLGYQITQHIRATVGYNFLYWSSVARAGKQIDPVVDPRLIPPPAADANLATRPLFPFNSTDFWAQGLTAGLEFTF
jgi:hypothetical protein